MDLSIKLDSFFVVLSSQCEFHTSRKLKILCLNSKPIPCLTTHGAVKERLQSYINCLCADYHNSHNASVLWSLTSYRYTDFNPLCLYNLRIWIICLFVFNSIIWLHCIITSSKTRKIQIEHCLHIFSYVSQVGYWYRYVNIDFEIFKINQISNVFEFHKFFCLFDPRLHR